MVDFENFKQMTKEQADTYLENDKKFADLAEAQAEYIRNKMDNEKSVRENTNRSIKAIAIGGLVLTAILPTYYLVNDIIDKIKARREKKKLKESINKWETEE